MRRQGAFWYANAYEKIPWWMGFVEDCELTARCTVVPINLALSWWLVFWRGLQYRWCPASHRFAINRKALRKSFERGREMGFNQGRAHEAMNPRAAR